MDKDVVNLIHYLRWHVSVDWNDLAQILFCELDTPTDAAHYLASNGKTLPEALRRFVLDVDQQLTSLPRADFMFSFPLSEPQRSPGDQRHGFLAMPYGFDWFAPVKEVIVDAAEAENFYCEVSKDMYSPGHILDQIWWEIRRSEVVVADVTGGNPNVYYEVGLAHALGKDIIFLTQDPGPLPFDVSTSRLIKYSRDDLKDLDTQVRKAFAAVPERYKFDRKS